MLCAHGGDYSAVLLSCITRIMKRSAFLRWHLTHCLACCISALGPGTPGAAPRTLQKFPADYNQAVRQAQAAAWAALEDGASLVEVEFPTASLASVAGDAEGEGCGQVQCKTPVPLAPGLPTQPCGLLGCSPTSPGLTFFRTATFPALLQAPTK